MPSPPMSAKIVLENGQRISVGLNLQVPFVTLTIHNPGGSPHIAFLSAAEAAHVANELKTALSIVERSQQSATECNHANARTHRPLHTHRPGTESEKAKTGKTGEATQQGI